MKTFKEDNKISLNDKVEADDDEAEPFLVGDETHKQMLYTQESTTRTHYARLVKYVRVIDYMLLFVETIPSIFPGGGDTFQEFTTRENYPLPIKNM